MKLILITSLLFAGSVYASPTTDAAAALARSSGCMACHAVDRRMVGPSFREITSRYATQPNVVQQMGTSIRTGSSGRWGHIQMPGNTRLTDEQVRQLAAWSLGHR